MRKLLLLLALLAGLAAVATGCGSDENGGAAAPTPAATGGTDTGAANACAKENLATREAGVLTIGTDNPAFPPWFQDADGAPWDPTTTPTKMGYEAAVAYALAGELGFSDSEVKWVVVPFETAFKPGPKDFDFDINQVSYTKKRDRTVDFSDSYYDVEQSVVVLKSSQFAGAKSLAELKDAKLGAAIGTTSYDAIVNTIQPSKDPAVYSSNNDAVTALKNGQVDGIVVDYPTSLYVTAVQVPKGTTIGRLPAAGQEHSGLMFEEGSPLRDCVNEAIASLREQGKLDEFAQRWIEGQAPPVLR